jgi:hypothetical protein
VTALANEWFIVLATKRLADVFITDGKSSLWRISLSPEDLARLQLLWSNGQVHVSAVIYRRPFDSVGCHFGPNLFG